MSYQSAKNILKDLKARRVSSLELVEQAIARIEKHDGKLNAVPVRDFDRARDAAKAADEAIARGDESPLLGIPMTVKESFNVAGLPTTWGIEGQESNIPNEDAVAVKRLKAAGAVILGKTNVPTLLTDWQSYNPVYGVTKNPWNIERSPGGSSGGAAASLAAGFTPLELGSDIGGSLRIPASFCGVFAHKPSFGIVPRRGHTHPMAPLLSIDHPVDLAVAGPMARHADDLMLELEVIAGPDEVEAAAYRLDLPAARHATLQEHRILVLDEHPLIPTSEDVRTEIQSFAERLEKSGCKVARSSSAAPGLEEIGTIYMKLLMSVFSADLPQKAYDRIVESARTLDTETPILEAAVFQGVALTHRDWILANRIRTLIMHRWLQFFKDFDVVISPVSSTAAFPHDHTEQNNRKLTINGEETQYRFQSMWISPATLSGLPSTAMPIGQNPEGLPIGVQIMGPYLEDRTPINFATLVEREFGGFVAPEGY